MKKVSISFSVPMVFMLMALAFTACSEEVKIPESDNEREGITEFSTDGQNYTNDEGTRTTTDSERYFYWTVGDRILVETGSGTWTQNNSSDITTTQSSAKFVFNTSLSGNSYNVRYTGYGSSNPWNVTIASTQTQSGWKNANHIATSGDCGVAVASRQGTQKYGFTLEHKASYILLYPHMVSSIPSHYPLNRSYTLMKVEITASNSSQIAGTFNFGSSGITGSATSGGTSTITLNCGSSGFSLSNNSNPSANYLVVVMRPVENTILGFKYYVKDDTDGTIITYETRTGSRTYTANGFTKLTHAITDLVFDMPFYTKWGASVAYSANSAVNTNTIAPNQVTNGNWTYTPNVNQLVWYVGRGNPMVDNSSRWRITGQSTFYSVGLWMLKRENISGFSVSQDYLGTDRRDKNYQNNVNNGGKYICYEDNPTIGKPASADITKYFYLPAFGYYIYTTHELINFGVTCYYWQRTAGGTADYAMRLGASVNTINIEAQPRAQGFVMGANWFQ